MSENVYAAPRANLDEQFHSNVEDHFYVISTRKMMTLFFLTFGLFQLHWNFQNWLLHKRATGENIWPLPRAIFAIFFTHSLYRKIGGYDATGKRGAWDSGSYSSAMVFLMLIEYVLSWAGKSSKFFDVISILLIIPIALLMKQVQVEVNARSGDPAGSSNDNFTVANIIWCAIGVAIWFFAAIGILFGP